jgi:GT2 family glycosyltransferase
MSDPNQDISIDRNKDRDLHSDDVQNAPQVEPANSPQQTFDVSVVIVNYNVREFLIQALQSVRAASVGLNVETIVVDNNSIDDSVSEVRRLFPDVTMIANDVNLGFGSANNLAIKKAAGRYILILNPDTIIREDTLEVLVSFMDQHPEAGAAGCRIINPDGTFARESRRSFPSADVAFYRMTGLSQLFPKSKRFGRYNLSYLSEDEVAEIDALSGSCMMVRTEALIGREVRTDRRAAGLFDEAFFMYGEDLDLCYRIQRSGWKIYYVPDTEIVHYKGESTKKGDLKYVRHFYGAMLLFIEKHFDSDRSKLVTLLLRIGIMIRAGLGYGVHHARRAAPVLLDFIIVYGTVTMLAVARFAAVGRSILPLFYVSVALSYALSTVIAIGSFGGYKRSSEFPVKAALTGITIGCLVAASSAFFVPATAFSRIVVATGLPLCALFLTAWRFAWKTRHGGPHLAVLVGDQEEARRLGRLLDAHPTPPFLLAGFVTDTPDHAEKPAPPAGRENGPSRLGSLTQLRDLVRLKQIREIVFAARDVANQDIISMMRGFQGLDVQFRMLHEGSEHVIGKSKIAPISLVSLLAQLPEVMEIRTSVRRRLFEIPMAAAGLIALPFLWPLGLIAPDSTAGRLSQYLRKMPGVLSGSLNLVGVEEGDADRIPPSWGLKKGVFSITNTLNTRALEADEITRAYWYYATHQSPGFDIDIVVQSIRAKNFN